MIRFIICDDDSLCCRTTEEQVQTWAENIDLPITIITYKSSDQLLREYVPQDSDILLLEIVMPGTSGMEAARRLRSLNQEFKIIFLTFSRDYAIESYEVNAYYYLLKPLDRLQLNRVLDRLLPSLKRPDIIIRGTDQIQKVHIDSIEYIEVFGHTTMVHLVSGSLLESRNTLHNYEQELSSQSFFKCHRSYLINLKNIKHLESASVTMRSGHSVPIARGMGKFLKDAYFSQIYEENCL